MDEDDALSKVASAACEQVPWRALQSRPVVVELSDVWLCACPRGEEEWEEDLAGQRAKVVACSGACSHPLFRPLTGAGVPLHEGCPALMRMHCAWPRCKVASPSCTCMRRQQLCPG